MRLKLNNKLYDIDSTLQNPNLPKTVFRSHTSPTTNMSLNIVARTALRSNSRRAFSTVDRKKPIETYDAVLQKFADIRACAVLRTATSEACPKAMGAAIDGGFKIVEFTLTTPDCLEHLSNFREKYDGDVMVGCGTILTIEDAERAVDAGCKLLSYHTFIRILLNHVCDSTYFLFPRRLILQLNLLLHQLCFLM